MFNASVYHIADGAEAHEPVLATEVIRPEKKLMGGDVRCLSRLALCAVNRKREESPKTKPEEPMESQRLSVRWCASKRGG